MPPKIPSELKSEFKKGFEEYIRGMGRKIRVYLSPNEVDCPNCMWDNVQHRSAGNWNTQFIRPVNIFPGTEYQQQVYPQPFNVQAVPSGIQYNPTNPNPKILKTGCCPVCMGKGKLYHENSVCIQAVITTGYGQSGGPTGGYADISPGLDGNLVTRLKTFASNYAICREATYYMVDGVRMENHTPPRLKGLGNLSITEAYIAETKPNSTNTAFDSDKRLDINTNGQMSNQASPVTPTIPPVVPGDDVW